MTPKTIVIAASLSTRPLFLFDLSAIIAAYDCYDSITLIDGDLPSGPRARQLHEQSFHELLSHRELVAKVARLGARDFDPQRW